MRVPVFLLTGFLGSGKTTLLAAWLRRQPLADTAVIINEAGEVQIDGVLVGEASEQVTILEGGCVCCAVLDDLGRSIETLLDACERGDIPRFSRMLVETSGLADPGPVAQSLMADPRIRHRVAYQGTVTVVDGVNGAADVARYAEAVAQVQLADHVILTKGDLADAVARARAESAVRGLNAEARLIWSSPACLADPIAEGLLGAAPLAAARACGSGHAHAPGCDCAQHRRRSGLQAHAFRFARPIEGAALIEALDLLEQLFEGEIVRGKALFADRASGTGYAVHMVRGVMDVPEEIAGLDAAATGLVLFSSSLSRERLAQAISPFVPLLG